MTEKELSSITLPSSFCVWELLLALLGKIGESIKERNAFVIVKCFLEWLCEGIEWPETNERSKKGIQSPSKLTGLSSSDGTYHTGSRNSCRGSIASMLTGSAVKRNSSDNHFGNSCSLSFRVTTHAVRVIAIPYMNPCLLVSIDGLAGLVDIYGHRAFT